MKKAEKQRRKQLELQQKYPDTCFCKEHSYSKDEFIEERTFLIKHPVYGPPEGTWYTYNFYKCPECGKEYHEPEIALA